MAAKRGKITPNWFITCGRCKKTELLSGTTHSRTIARNKGWSYHYANGWICPSCTSEGKKK